MADWTSNIDLLTANDSTLLARPLTTRRPAPSLHHCHRRKGGLTCDICIVGAGFTDFQLAQIGIDYAWSGTPGITRSRMPHFERLEGNILTMSGYSGSGVAMATLAGRLAAEAIAGQAERFDLLAQVPTPAFPGGSRLRTPLLALAMLWYSLRDRI